MKKYYILLMMLWQLQSAFATNGLFPTFMGTQAAGRAGTDIGVAIDATCIATNPAGIGFLHGKQVELSVGSFFLLQNTKINIMMNASNSNPPRWIFCNDMG